MGSYIYIETCRNKSIDHLLQIANSGMRFLSKQWDGEVENDLKVEELLTFKTGTRLVAQSLEPIVYYLLLQE
jgi:hypothetical protein